MKPLFLIVSCIIFLLFSDCSNVFVQASVGSKCDLTKLFTCGQNETCVQENKDTGRCDCLPGFAAKNGICIPKTPDSHTTASPVTTEKPTSSSPHPQHSENGRSVGLMTGLLIACVLVLPLGGAIFYFGRRHKWLDRLHKLTIRNYNTVLVSSANDDDAPIT